MENPQHAKGQQAKPEANLKFGEPGKQDFATYIQLHRFTYVWQPIFFAQQALSRILDVVGFLLVRNQVAWRHFLARSGSNPPVFSGFPNRFSREIHFPVGLH